MQGDQDNVFLRAARLVGGAGGLTSGGDADRAAAQLVRALGYGGGDDDEVLQARRLLTFAGSYLDLFGVHSPDARAYHFLGAMPSDAGLGLLGQSYRTTSFSGAGPSLQAAFQRCVGEAAEFFSHVLVGRRATAYPIFDDHRALDRVDACDHWARAAPGGLWRFGDDVVVRRLSDNRKFAVPAPLLVRSPETGDWFAPGSGCAAGARFDDALQSAVLEVVERDAIALWWHGGRRARRIEDATTRDLIIGARTDPGAAVERSGRRTAFLDITCDMEIPCVAAISCRADGTHAVFGFGSNLDGRSACASALREMLQMELGQHLILAKHAQGGTTSLTPWEHHMLDRFQSLNVDRDLELDALPLVQTEALHDARDDFARLLSGNKIDIYYKDITSDLVGIPAVKVLIPVLQPYPCNHVTPRLKLAVSSPVSTWTGQRRWDVL